MKLGPMKDELEEEMEVDQDSCNESDHEPEIPLQQLIPPAPDFTNLINKLESNSGNKLVKLLLKRSKEISKLITHDPQIGPSLEESVEKSSSHFISNPDKSQKLLSKESHSFSCDGDVFKTFLKNGMKSAENGQGGSTLISILTSLFNLAASQGRILNPVLGIQMLLSHSKAEEIFLEVKVKVRHPPRVEQDEEYKLRPRAPLMEPLKFSNIKAELLKLWLTLVQSFSKVSKLVGTENDKKILENSVAYLLQMYNATLSNSDRHIFSILKLYTSKKLQVPLESMPLFGPKCFEAPPIKANPLYAHSIRANSVLGLISEEKAYETGMKFEEADWEEGSKTLEEYYDIRFLLPLLCHVLDEKNICDSVKVMSNGWIHFIMRGLGLNDPVLRSVALLSYKRLVFNLHLAKGFRLQDVKIWLHFLNAVKKGMGVVEECRLSNLVSMWMVATCQILNQPAHLMYPRVTHFLLAKPVLNVAILPDFIPFYNAVDGNKESREWILNILLKGLKDREDWRIAQKLPTIKFLCSSFFLEKIITQRIILNILASGARIPEVAQDMVDRHSLLLWIANVEVNDDKYYRRELFDIFRNLMDFCPPGAHRDSLFQFVASKHNWTCSRQLLEIPPNDDESNIN